MARSGKSVVVETLAYLIRQIFNQYKSVMICAPTGNAAYHIGGQTCYRQFGVAAYLKFPRVYDVNRKRLLNEMEFLVAIIVDKRSLLSAKLMGVMESYTKECAFGRKNSHMLWGEYQL